SERGRVPKNFLPGAIWFDKAGDFKLGIAYVTDEAFENPTSKLRFLGASIHSATQQEWEDFGPVDAQNLLSPEWFSRAPPRPSKAEIRNNLWNKDVISKWWPAFDCHGVRRYRLSEPAARAVLKSFWPESRPAYWMPKATDQVLSRLDSLNGGKGPLIEGHYYRDYFKLY